MNTPAGFSRGMGIGQERTAGMNNRQQAKRKNFLMVKNKRSNLQKRKSSLKSARNQLNRHMKNLKRNAQTLSRIRTKRKKR